MIDLHTHTKGSDGDNTPQELIDLAISKNIKVLAITDHDTICSINDAVEYAKNKDILLIPGIEIEAQTEKGQMHILGLFIDYKSEELKQKLVMIEEGRNNRNAKFIKEFKKLGFDVTEEELKEVSNGKIVGKPHFAKIFLKKKYIKEKEEMFKEYFNKSPFKEIPKACYSPKEVIEIIKRANGIAILAHPQTLKLSDNELKEKIMELKKYGLDGIECYHSKQTTEQMIKYSKIAIELNLIITKGSDYHGPITKKHIELGTGMNDNIIKEDEEKIIKELLQKHK